MFTGSHALHNLSTDKLWADLCLGFDNADKKLFIDKLTFIVRQTQHIWNTTVMWYQKLFSK